MFRSVVWQLVHGRVSSILQKGGWIHAKICDQYRLMIQLFRSRRLARTSHERNARDMFRGSPPPKIEGYMELDFGGFHKRHVRLDPEGCPDGTLELRPGFQPWELAQSYGTALKGRQIWN